MRRGAKWNKVPDKNQKKITQFFIKPESSNNSNSSSVNSTPQTLYITPRQRRPKWTDDGDYADVHVLTPPPPTPKELVDLISSDENETEQEEKDDIVTEDNSTNNPASTAEEALHSPPQATTSKANNDPSTSPASPTIIGENSNHSSTNLFQESSCAEELSTKVDVNDIVSPSNQENNAGLSPSYSPFNEDSSSGDDMLSQIDMDEMIRSSQSSLNTNGSRPNSPSILSTPDKENCHKPVLCSSSSKVDHQAINPSTSIFKSPKKKVSPPKSQLTKYSPIRHLSRKKRSSSEASLDSISVNYPISPSPSKFQNGVSTNQSSQSPTKRKLNFGTSNSSSQSGTPGVAGGQARYFLRNFLTILSDVISDKFHAHLIHTEDHRLVQDFVSLSIDAQHLYVRLFQRKWCWRPANKLNNKNKELPEDLTEACAELQARGLLEQISSSNCGTIEEVLDILDLGKLGSLAKKMKLNPTKKTKEAFRDALLSSGKNQKTLTGVVGASSTVLIKHALSELGPAVRVSHNSKMMFSRLFLLHSPPQYWEVENDQASNQLLIVLLNQMGQMEYPSYTIRKSTAVYPTRDHLIQFHDAFALHSNVVAFREAKEWNEVVSLAGQGKSALQSVLDHQETQNHDSKLPLFLKIYTAGSVLTHSLWLALDGFQKLKMFEEANQLIRFLLEQLAYLNHYRGRWWERLVINCETHLKKSKEEVKAVLLEALKDKHLKEHHRFTLSQRLEKVNATLSKKKKLKPKVKAKPKPKKKVVRKGRRKATKYLDDSDDDDETDEEEAEINDEVTQVIDVREFEPEAQEVETLSLKHEIRTRTITGEKLDQGPGAMGKSIFISRRDTSGSNRMGSVEQFVIDHYIDNEGYTYGIHGEGSTVVTMYGLLFWDVIFHDEIDDCFHHRYQPFPLDLHFEEFYERRQHLIDEKLILIRTILGMEDLIGIVDEIWAKNEKKLSIVSWAMFENNLEKLKSLMRAMGREMIASICERLAKNYRQYSSGFPDLVVWKESDGEWQDRDLFEEDGKTCENSCDCSPAPNKGKVLFVEVKGPGDHLSEKQQLWLEFMSEKEIPSEVCLVKSVSNKRIRLCK